MKNLVYWWKKLEINKNEAKEQKGGFLGMLIGTLEAKWLTNILEAQLERWWRSDRNE